MILALVTAGHGPALLGIPLAATFYFMWGAWLYCVRGVLVALMENKRRRRLVVAIATLTFVLIAQLPNLVGRLHIKHILGRRRAERVTQIEDVTSKDPNAAPRKRAAAPEDIDSYDPSKEEIQEEIERWKFAVIVANIVVPLGWFSYGMYALLADSAGEAVLCILASGLFGALGISIGYRSTWRYYMGISSGRKRKRAAAKPRAAPAEKGFLMNRSVPFVADDTSAAAVAAFLTYVRHPHVRLMLIMPIVFGALFFGLYLGKVANLESVVARNLLMAAVVVWPMMNTGMLALNLFGVDRRGFGTYILLPSKRHTYLLAKNLALLPIACAPSFLFVTIVSVFVRPSITVLAIALIQVLQLYLIFCIAGNLFSCWLPWRMQWDAMRASKHTWTTGLHGLLIFFLAPLLAIPTAACLTLDPLLTWALGYRGIPVGPVVAVGLLVSTAFVYRASLDRAGRVLMRREKIIYDKVREEDE